MKNFKLLLLAVFAIFSLNSCEENDDLVFTAAPEGEFTFVNSFLDEYVLTTTTSNNIAERFVFNPAKFDVPSPINYVLETSVSGDFTDAMDLTSPTTTNEIPVTVGQLINLATDAGITENGILNFRVKAFLGDLATTTEFSYSPIQMLNVTIATDAGGGSGIEPVSWGIVGSGYNNWGAFEDQTFYSTDQAGVFFTHVTLVDGEIKFRENNMWDNDFGDTGADGTLEAGGDNIVVTAGTYKIIMNTNDNTYTMEPFSWGVVGSGYNDWGASPDARFTYDYVTDTYKVGVRLVDGEIKFRKNNDWNEDFGDTGADMTLEAGGDNIVVTAGHYAITLDFNAGTYTMEPTNLYGVVGSGYNDWGATQDFTFTPLSNDIWVAEVVTLVDGEIKFRINDAWDSDFGDTGADGTLDAGGDNIVVTAGNYRIKLNLMDNTYSLNQL